MRITLANEHETIALGVKIGQACQQYFLKNRSPIIILLNGDLGAGKTTFSRGVLQAFGYLGNVKSPTYTLVEPYELGNDLITIYHFDLYRAGDPDELEYIGFRDYFSERTLSLIEWPEKAGLLLPSPDLTINFNYESDHRIAEIINHSKHINL